MPRARSTRSSGSSRPASCPRRSGRLRRTACASRWPTTRRRCASSGRAGSPGSRTSARFRPAHRRCARQLRSEEHTSELQSHSDLVCRLLLEKKKKNKKYIAKFKSDVLFDIRPNGYVLEQTRLTSSLDRKFLS